MGEDSTRFDQYENWLHEFPGMEFDDIENEDLKSKLTALHYGLQNLVDEVPASVKYHHNWTGGYKDHVRQVVDHAVNLYRLLFTNRMARFYITKTSREPDFTLDDVILVAYIHDLDKLFRYKRLEQPKDGREWEYANVASYDESAKVTQLCAKYGIYLEDKHLAALAMHHGGWSANPNRTMSPLAVIIHTADLISTFITNRKGE